MPAVKKILVLVSILFYVVSCFNMAYHSPTNDGGVLGAYCLVFGWTTLFWNFSAFVAWLANFPYFINIVLVLISKKTSTRIMTSILAIVTLFLSFGAFGVSEVLKDEAGNYEPATFGAALFIWIFSILIMVVAAVLPAEKKEVEVKYINNPNPIK